MFWSIQLGACIVLMHDAGCVHQVESLKCVLLVQNANFCFVFAFGTCAVFSQSVKRVGRISFGYACRLCEMQNLYLYSGRAYIVLKQNASTLTESCFYYAWYLRKMQNLYRLFIFGVCIICLPGAKRIGWWLPGVRHFKCMLVVSKFM